MSIHHSSGSIFFMYYLCYNNIEYILPRTIIDNDHLLLLFIIINCCKKIDSR